MNGARTTFMRRGYLLTALAAAVLLAASPGIASAQTPSVSITSSVTVNENAATGSTTNPPVKVTVRVSGLPSGPTGNDGQGNPTARQRAIDALGDLTYRVENPASGASQVTVDPTGQANAVLDTALEDTDEIELTLTSSDDTNWIDESFTLAVVSTANINTGDPLQGTIKDDEFVPVAKFSRTNIKITENSSTNLSVEVQTNSGAPGAADTVLVANNNATDGVILNVSPADAVFVIVDGTTECPTDGSDPPAPLGISTPSGSTATYDATEGTLTINGLATLGTAQAFTLQACDDMTGFRDPMITLSFDAESLMSASGNVTAGMDAMIHIESDEVPPTVGFTPTDIAIPEGGSTRVIIAAEGDLSGEISTVTLSQEGDAMVYLHDSDGTAIMPGDDGYVRVDLAGQSSTRLSAVSMSDPDLMDGETKTRTWKIQEMDGVAPQDDGYWLTVTVNGSTAVPALPLVAQLLLALFLMAGGSRLYRRRQG